MCEITTTEFGIDKTNNVAVSDMVYPTTEIFDVNFNEEKLIHDEWLHINMFLFGETIPLVSGSQVEENMFATIEVCK